MARILLLDDDIAGITAVKRLVARTGHRAQLATTAADAAGAIARDPPDLLLVASACDGGQALSLAVDASADGAPLPVIVLGEAAGLPAGVRILGLPIDAEQLGREIDGVLAADSRPRSPPPPPRAPSRVDGAEALRTRAGPLRTSAPAVDAPATAAGGGLADGSEDPRGWADELAGADGEPPAADELAAEMPVADERREATEPQRRAEEEAPRRARIEEEERLREAIASARAELELMRRRPARPATPPAHDAPEPPPLAPSATPAAAEPTHVAAERTHVPAEPTHVAPEPTHVAAEATNVAAEPTPVAAEPTLAAPSLERAAPPSLPVPPEELRGGTLADLPAPRLLALAAGARLVGRLDLEGEVLRSLWFEDGRVVGAASADPAERVEALAVRLGLVTRDQHQQIAVRAAALPAPRAALLLLDAGFLKPAELSGLVRRRTEEVVFGIFGDAGARFRWVPEEVPADERGPVERPPLALAVEGVRRRWSASRLDAILGGPDTILCAIADGPPAAALALSPEERQVAALADGLRTLAQIGRASPLDAFATRQVLGALILIGALAVRRLASRPSAEAARAIDLARLADKLDQARRCDYFAVLGLPRSSTSHEVREAAGRLEEDLDPRRHAGGGEPALAEGLADLLQVVRDARAVLGDDALRQAYLAALGE